MGYLFVLDAVSYALSSQCLGQVNFCASEQSQLCQMHIVVHVFWR